MLHERVLHIARSSPDHTAFVDAPTGLRVTYGLLGERIEGVAAGLAARGLEPGFVAAIWERNMPQWAGFALGVMRAGGVVTGVSPAATEEELARQLVDSRARVLLAAPERIDTALAAARAAGLPEVVATGAAPGAVDLVSLVTAGGRAPMPDAGRSPGDLALLPYSSGTTGLPKGVMLTHTNLEAALGQVTDSIRVCSTDTTIALAPFAHIMGFMLGLAAPLANGATVITDDGFEFTRFLRLAEEHRATYLALPPPVMRGLARHPLVDRHDLSSLRLVASGGAPLPAADQEAVARRLPGVAVGQGYGMTETTVAITMPDPERNVAGSVGRLAAGTEARLLTDAGLVAPAPALEGELLVRGPQVMAGYLGRPDATEEAFLDGWLRTGDLVRFDAEGNLFVIDRLKELIKVNANQVAPAELEALLVQHPAIADAAVVGRPDDKCGEVPVAFVVADGEVEGDTVARWVAGRVAPYKRIAAVHVVDQLPRTPAGKLLRRRLADRNVAVAA